MKIIGFVYNDGEAQMVLKGDSCLLNNRKPMFVPDWTQELGVTECMILRVSRLGKGIARKFASRYYDAVAPGADFTAFDYSLAVGKWIMDNGQWTMDNLVLHPDEAIVEASKVMTIRQGDLIYIQKRCAPRPVQKEEVIRIETNGEEQLYCKIK